MQVNDMDMKGVTREEAVLFLLSLQDQIDLIVQYRKDEYEQIVASQRGDSFHIKWVDSFMHSLKEVWSKNMHMMRNFMVCIHQYKLLGSLNQVDWDGKSL